MTVDDDAIAAKLIDLVDGRVSPAQFEDPELKALIEQSLAIGPSHELPLTNLTPQMRWYYGRSSQRPEPVLRPTRRPRRQR